MSKRLKVLVAGALMVLPFAAGACQVPIGNGCTLLLAEPGANVGVVCN